MGLPTGKHWPQKQMVVALRPVAVAIAVLYGRPLTLPPGAWPLRNPRGDIEAVVFFD